MLKMNYKYIKLSDAISDARKKINLNQKQLAKKIIRQDGVSISAQYMNDIENDKRRPSSDYMIKQLSKVLKINVDYLHYLNGRFPENERKNKLNPQQFEKAISYFRKIENKIKEV